MKYILWGERLKFTEAEISKIEIADFDSKGTICEYKLPKRCSCTAFIDTDGKPKCKKCKKLWTDLFLNSGECGDCGYQGD